MIDTEALLKSNFTLPDPDEVDDQAQPETESDGPAFEPMTMADLLAMPPKEWLIENVIGAGDMVMLYGGSGSGKTHVAIDLIFSALAGQRWAMRFDVARPLNVCYAAGEGISGLQSRFAAVSDFYSGCGCDWANFTFFRNVPQMFEGSYTTNMRKFIAEWKARQGAGKAPQLDILIIDTLHAAAVGSDENSARDSGVILSMAKRAVTELGCAVVLIHHTGKNGNNERGSSALRGAMDTMLLIERFENGTKAKLTCTKLKDGAEWKPQTLDLVEHLDSVRVWWDEPNEGGAAKGKEDEHRETMLAFMQGQPGKKMTAKVLAEVAGIGQTHANKILAAMVKAELCNSELMDTQKPNSNRNPLAYFVPASEIEKQGL